MLAAGDRERDAAAIERLVDRLVSEQYRDENGFDLGAEVHGGWGFGVRPPGHPGHMDVSITRHVLEALAEAATGGLLTLQGLDELLGGDVPGGDEHVAEEKSTIGGNGDVTPEGVRRAGPELIADLRRRQLYRDLTRLINRYALADLECESRRRAKPQNES